MLDSLNEFLKKSTTLGLIFSFPTLFYVLSILYCRLFVCTIVTLHGRVETVDRKQGNWLCAKYSPPTFFPLLNWFSKKSNRFGKNIQDISTEITVQEGIEWMRFDWSKKK